MIPGQGEVAVPETSTGSPSGKLNRPRRQGRHEGQARCSHAPGLVHGWETRAWPSGNGSIPSFAGRTITIIQAGLLVQPDKLVATALYLRDKNPIPYDYLASLQSVHPEGLHRGQPSARQHPEALQGQVDPELRVRPLRPRAREKLPFTVLGVSRGPIFRNARYDMMGVRFNGHLEFDAIPMWDGFAYFSRCVRTTSVSHMRVRPRCLPAASTRDSASISARRRSIPTAIEFEGSSGPFSTGRSSPAATTPRGCRSCPAASRSRNSRPTSSS